VLGSLPCSVWMSLVYVLCGVLHQHSNKPLEQHHLFGRHCCHVGMSLVRIHVLRFCISF
jgi:hypothetical protein